MRTTFLSFDQTMISYVRWLQVTSYPGGGISEHCAVADEGYDRIYSLGGYNCYNYTSWSRTYEQCGESSDAYQYRVSSDSWSTFPALRYTSAQIGCAITRRASTGNRLLLVTGNYLKGQFHQKCVPNRYHTGT